MITAELNLDLCAINKGATFNFALHRRVEHYRLIVERTGAQPPGG